MSVSFMHEATLWKGKEERWVRALVLGWKVPSIQFKNMAKDAGSIWTKVVAYLGGAHMVHGEIWPIAIFYK